MANERFDSKQAWQEFLLEENRKIFRVKVQAFFAESSSVGALWERAQTSRGSNFSFSPEEVRELRTFCNLMRVCLRYKGLGSVSQDVAFKLNHPGLLRAMVFGDEDTGAMNAKIKNTFRRLREARPSVRAQPPRAVVSIDSAEEAEDTGCSVPEMLARFRQRYQEHVGNPKLQEVSVGEVSGVLSACAFSPQEQDLFLRLFAGFARNLKTAGLASPWSEGKGYAQYVFAKTIKRACDSLARGSVEASLEEDSLFRDLVRDEDLPGPDRGAFFL